MWFIGQKVVCVNARFPTHILEWASKLPRQGEIYTIRLIEWGPCLYTRRVTVGLHLHELPTLQDRLAFRADRFAPLLEKIEQVCKANALELTSLPSVPLRGSRAAQRYCLTNRKALLSIICLTKC
jgi:hypothetical protein